MPRKKFVNHIDKEGKITKIEIEIPDDQDIDEIQPPSQEEFNNNQPLKKIDFINVLNKTYTEINKMNDRITTLESIITEHNNLLKQIIKNISK
jgi:glutaredoxin 2